MFSNIGTTGNIKDKLRARGFSVLNHCLLLLLTALNKDLLYSNSPKHLSEPPLPFSDRIHVLPSLFHPLLSACLIINTGFQEVMLQHMTHWFAQCYSGKDVLRVSEGLSVTFCPPISCLSFFFHSES